MQISHSPALPGYLSPDLQHRSLFLTQATVYFHLKPSPVHLCEMLWCFFVAPPSPFVALDSVMMRGRPRDNTWKQLCWLMTGIGTGAWIGNSWKPGFRAQGEVHMSVFHRRYRLAKYDRLMKVGSSLPQSRGCRLTPVKRNLISLTAALMKTCQEFLHKDTILSL